MFFSLVMSSLCLFDISPNIMRISQFGLIFFFGMGDCIVLHHCLLLLMAYPTCWTQSYFILRLSMKIKYRLWGCSSHQGWKMSLNLGLTQWERSRFWTKCSFDAFEILCASLYYLYDFKNVKNTHGKCYFSTKLLKATFLYSL